MQRLLYSLLFLAASFAFAQNTTPEQKPKDSLAFWTKKNKIGLDISQITFVNWNAGGNTSLSGLAHGRFERDYKKDRLQWDNELIVRYGINKQEGQKTQKTDDQIQLTSTFGYQQKEKSLWLYSAKFNFNTQLAPGYSYPNRDIAISRLMAPAYLFLGVGAEYSNKEKKIEWYLSPVTQKSTFVLNQRLADKGAYGVEKAEYDVDGNVIRKGKKSRNEIGFLITNHWEKEVFTNIFLDHRLSLYSDYLNNFGNIDVDWRFEFELKVNKYVRATIGNHIIYDDDIKTTKEFNGEEIERGPKIQLKQMLTVGMVYNF